MSVRALFETLDPSLREVRDRIQGRLDADAKFASSTPGGSESSGGEGGGVPPRVCGASPLRDSTSEVDA